MINCSICKIEKDQNDFIHKNGKILKTCSMCRELRNKKYSCEHNKQRRQCKDCNGSSMCHHGRRRCQCKDCGGASVCQHGRRRRQCKKCGNAVDISIMYMICNAKHYDKSKNIYDANNHIDKCFIEQLIFDSKTEDLHSFNNSDLFPSCHYCKILMQFIDYDDTLCTIERLDNNKGHIKSNCVLACKSCNVKRVGNKT